MPFKEKLSLKFLIVIFKIFKLASFSSRLSPRGRIFKRISITATLVPIAHEVTILIFSFVKPYQVTQFNHWLLLLFKIDCQGRNAIEKVSNCISPLTLKRVSWKGKSLCVKTEMISFANQYEYTSTDFHEHFSYSESLRVSYNIFLHLNNQA